MGMNQTPVSERVHIGFFGKRNCWLTDFQLQMVIVALRA